MNIVHQEPTEFPVAAASTRAAVVIIGAGLSGMVAAYELRDREIVVLEKLDRVGGRTLSGVHGEYWYNLGAQYVWDHRTVGYCKDLDIELLPARDAYSSIFVRGQLVTARNPYALFARLPLSIAERVDLARTITGLRIKARRLRSPSGRDFDRKSLSDLMGHCTKMTRKVLDLVTTSGTGLDASGVSGWIGLGYAIHLFGGNVNDTLKQVRGGTQALSERLFEAIGTERVQFGAGVTKVTQDGEDVLVTYVQGGQNRQVRADACVVATTADVVSEIVDDLSLDKRRALSTVTPYAPIVATAWLTNEDRAMPWDRTLVTPVIDDTVSFEQIGNNSLFLRSQHGESRHAGGVLVTLSTSDRARKMWSLNEDEVRRRVGDDLTRIFPSAASVLETADVRVQRWHALPAFRPGWLASRAELRAPNGSVFFCGDYTSQPGTPGAVGSGYHAARAVRSNLAAPSSAVDGASR
ncbi:MAG: flavin monoamine oxidase family protein [Acidimicrobiales bacterium]